MKLYNTLSRTVEDFQPMHDSHVGFYACGPTVYDYAHLGHLRKYTMDDVLVRTLRHAGYEVKFVENITDVGHLASDEDTGEDKMEKGAKKYGKSVWEIAREFEDFFWKSMDSMNIVRPDVSCRATDHIAEQLEMVKELERLGFTYVIEGDGVYFDTSKLDDYGKLQSRKVTESQSEVSHVSRIGEVDGKRNPTDFALWKFERPGENRAMVWESPWAKRSFPGWHIECSAMSMKYLGQQFDIHTGGIDHIPVHHTNEIAQAEAETGKKPFVKYWVHHNFLKIEHEKMSKSLGNFFTIDDVREKGFDPMALRLLFLGTHYRSEMNFTWENLAGSQKAWQNLQAKIVQYKQAEMPAKMTQTEEKLVEEFHVRFFQKIEDDLNTSEALAVLWEVIKSELPDSLKLELLLDFDEVLGLGMSKLSVISYQLSEIRLKDLPEKVRELVEERNTAREEKNWEKADELRKKIEELGYELVDEDGKTLVRLKS